MLTYKGTLSLYGPVQPSGLENPSLIIETMGPLTAEVLESIGSGISTAVAMRDLSMKVLDALMPSQSSVTDDPATGERLWGYFNGKVFARFFPKALQGTTVQAYLRDYPWIGGLKAEVQQSDHLGLSTNYMALSVEAQSSDAQTLANFKDSLEAVVTTLPITERTNLVRLILAR
ncbi:hypothetical protein HYY73_02120 [Candidatus Woesearchaeota archaeon]|nr:hypothetical protein [Candidatus Woesearchaeota archaeon]